MLVLTRQEGQRICIGNGVVVAVLGTSRGKVRLGIEAPPDVSVDREEIRQRQLRETRALGIFEETEPLPI